MIVGVGTDIVHIARIRKLRPAVVSRLLTTKEEKYCRDYKDPYERIAGRFAAKEAILKAMGTGLSGGITWKQVEIISDAKGAPRVKFSGTALRRLHTLNATRCHLSISHESEYALAFAILESE